MVSVIPSLPLSQKTTSAAPRLSASMPIAPLPLNRSTNRLPSMSNCNTLKMPCFAMSDVGLTSLPDGEISFLPLNLPPMILICDISPTV